MNQIPPNTNSVLLVGLDASSDWRKFGFAIGQIKDGRVDVERTGIVGSKKGEPTALAEIGARLARASQALVAIDAPLGWPSSLGSALVSHQAGHKLQQEKNALFHRATDDFVTKTIGKRPLEVGADRIARAAHCALDALARLEDLSARAIEMAWHHDLEGVRAVEVYPAATLKTRGLVGTGYKKPEESDARREIARQLKEEMPDLRNHINGEIHAFDACLCLVGAKDFLEGTCYPPENEATARKEGWIWVRRTRDL